jgi:Mg2+-importing ATPase
VNDAPSLKASDVGISVKNGADIARDAADVVLLRKSLNVIAGGISEGRKTFANIIKYIRNTISANFGNMFTLAAASLFLPFIPLLPSQIILNNFLSDVPMLAVSTDNVDKENLKRPRHWDIDSITRFMVSFGLISSVFDFITIGFILLVLGAGVALFRTIWFVESAISEIMVVFAVRTSKPFYKSVPSTLLIALSVLSVLFAVGVTLSPIAPDFEFVPLTPFMVGIIFAIVITYVLIVEIAKHIYFRRYPE